MKRKKPLQRKAPLRSSKPLARGGLQRGSTRMARTRIKPKSRRGGSMPAEVYRAVMGRSGGRCEGALPGVCTGAAEEWHHRQPRARSNDTVANGAALCSACHRHITDVSPSVGFDRGLRVSRHLEGEPGGVPMLLRGREWVLLSDDGSVSSWKNDDDSG